MMISASLNSRAKNIIVEPIVVSELKLRDVQRQILGTDLVERADDTALEDAPEAFNRLSMDGTNNVLPLGVIDGPVREFYAKMLVTSPTVGAEQANLVRHGLVNERLQRDGAD